MTSSARPPSTMIAAVFHEHGDPSVLRIEEVPVPVPGPGQVLIEVRAAAMNHLDLWVRRGLPIETEMPHIGGSDFAGVVVSTGDGAEGLEPGARVVVDPILYCGRCRECRRGEESLCATFRLQGEHTNGGFAEYAVAEARNVYPIPDHVTFEEAAALPVSYQTAWRAIVGRAKVVPGEEVLVLGASGGTAIAAIQVALLAGATVYAVTSGSENVRRVSELGVDRVYDRTEVDFSRQVFADTGRRGVDVVVENVGEPTWEGSVRALAPGGRLVTFGATAGPKVALDLRRLFWRQLQIIGTTMASRAEFEAMLRAVWAGRLPPVIDTLLPLREIRTAHERLEAGDQFGKIVLQVSSTAG
jgi:NADPH:quinone reductase-like Zn-dependent oxidoreductase